MVPMRQDGHGWVPVPRRRYAKLVVLLATLFTIVAFSTSMRQASGGNAVVRVSLDRVPEERVVEFGHERPRLALSMPVPAEGAITPASTAMTVAASRDEGPPKLVAPVPRKTPPVLTVVKALKPDAKGILPIDFQLQEGVSSQVGGVGVTKTLPPEGGRLLA